MRRLKPLDNLFEFYDAQAPQPSKYLLLLLDLVDDLAIQAQNGHSSKKKRTSIRLLKRDMETYSSAICRGMRTDGSEMGVIQRLSHLPLLIWLRLILWNSSSSSAISNSSVVSLI